MTGLLGTLQNDIMYVFSLQGFTALFSIIVIDVVMSGDNAIVVGMATKNLDEKQRKKAIFFGIMIATVMRIVFAFLVGFLLKIIGINIAGGVLLLYVVWKFYKEMRQQEHGVDIAQKGEKKSFFSAMMLIVIADISMSLDNVLAVAGASHNNLFILGIGLIVSIILMAVASNFIAKNIQKYPQIQWVGLLMILYIAIDMIMNGGHDISTKVMHSSINFKESLMPFFIFGLGMMYFIGHKKYLTPIKKSKIQSFLSHHYLSILLLNLFTIFFMGYWGDVVKTFLFSHIGILYTFTFLIFFCIIEVIAIHRK